MKKLYLIYLFALMFFTTGFSQLSPGDLMIVAINGDGNGAGIITGSTNLHCKDGFAFVALVDIPAGTSLVIEGQRYTNGSGFSPSSYVTWSTSSLIAAGTVITITTNTNLGISGCGSPSASHGTFGSFGGNTWFINAGSQELWIYEGSPSSNPSSLICGLVTNNANTDIPSAISSFTVDLTAVDVDADIAVFDGGSGSCSNVSTCVAEIINEAANWDTEDITNSLGDGFNNSGVEWPRDIPGNFPGYAPATAPEADVRNIADNADITDGSVTISTALGTDFGNVDIASGTASKTFRLENNGTGALTLGADALSLNAVTHFSITSDLTNNGTIAAGGVETFTIQFDPTSAGIKNATVTIRSDDSDEDPYTFSIQGVGVDNTAPTAGITMSDNALVAGETSTVTFTFSEAVVGFTNADLTIPNGTLTGLSSSDGNITFTATYTPTVNIEDAINVISLNNTGVADASGNAGTGTTNSPNFTIDTAAPTVTNVTSSTADGTYKANDVISIQVTFSEAVTVTGTPELTLETGTTDAVVDYASGSGTTTLTFTYTVAAGETATDLDYISTTALALNGGTIKDAVGNDATLTLAAPGAATSLGGNKALVIDTTVPTITNVTSSTADGTYKASDVISIQVTFSEVVNVTGTPQLTLETGTTDAVVDYASGSGSNTLTFTYTVAAGHTATDLDYVSTTAFALNGGTIKDAAGNDGTLTLAAPGAATSLGANKALVIDTTVPTITNVTSSTADGTYKASDVISIQVTFSEVVNVTGTPQLTLETGTTDAVVDYASGSGSNTLTFTYTVATGHTATDLDYVSTTALALNGGTIKDVAGNDGTLTLAAPGAATSLGANKALVIDTTVPTITNVTSSTADGTYKASDVISIQVTFSEVVNVAGTPQLTLETGTTDAVVDYASGSGSNTLTFTYTVAAGHTATDLDYVSTTALALNGGTIKDGAGNDGTLTLAAPGAATSLGGNKALVIDAIVPTITNVTSSTADGTYKASDVISIQVTFSEVVNVAGTPQLTLETGTTDAVVDYASGSGSNTLTFTYTVAAGHTATDLDYVSTTALALNGGTIKDAAGNDGTLTLAAPGAATSLGANKALVIDTTVPTITNVTSSTADGTYKASDVISIQVTFSEVVNVTGTPQLTLETGTTDAVVDYASGSGSNTLTFTYTVAAGNTATDLDYVSTTALALNGGTIKDVVGNDGTLTLAAPGAATSLGANKALVIDTTVPTVTNVTSSTADGTYKASDVISIQVTFSEVVNVTGTPQLTLETGTTDAVVDYASGSGSNTLTFTYTVAAGHTATDLDYVSTTALALNGGTIKDVVGNDGTLTLAAPGAATSLGANKALVIDTTVPTITNVTSSTADGTYKASDVISIQVTFSEVVNVTGTPQLTLETGTTDAVVDYASGSGSNTLTFTYTVAAGHTATDLDYVSTTALALNGGTIKDAGSNDATLTLATPGAAASLGANKALVIDTSAPTVSTLSPADGAIDQSTATNLVITFSENVVKGTGNITIHKKSDNSVVETIDVTNAIVSISGAVVTINPANDLVVDTEYYINIANTAFTDGVGNAYAGISNATDWDFKTVARIITVSAVANSPKAENATGTIDFTFTADVAPTSNLVINYTVSGTATSGTDYTALTGSVTMLTGATTATVSVDPTGDTDIESDETVILTLATGSGYAIGTTTTQTGTITNDDFCPALGALTAPASTCAGNNFNLSVNGLDKMASGNNGNQDFGIQFVAFTSAPADPYTGGTALGTVAFASLTGAANNQTATLSNVGNSLAAGSYVIYVILSPAHADASCRPSKSTNITIKATPTITFTSSNNGVICSGTNVTFTATGGTTYQFFVNNVSKQNGATATYTTNALAQGDKVKVTVTDAQNCPVTSTEYTANVNSTDTDGDTVPDCRDVCPGGDDLGPDLDNDMVPDECDCDSDDENDGTVTADDFLGQITTGHYQAGLELTADKPVEGNNTVTLQGGVCVILKAGFHAKAGSDVHAFIAPCVLPSPLIEDNEIVEQSFITLPSTDAIGPLDLTVAPNPFRESTMLNFRLGATEEASVALYDQAGRRMKWLLSPQTLDMGDYNIRLNRDHLQPGMYLVVLQTSQERITKKIMLVR